jgi:hypothetical protein
VLVVAAAHDTVGMKEMFLELGKFVSLMAGIVSLHAVFYTAFLAPMNGMRERVFDSLDMLILACGLCLASGMIFREWDRKAGIEGSTIAASLPMRIFWWFSGVVVVMLAASWYLQVYYLPLNAFNGR